MFRWNIKRSEQLPREEVEFINKLPSGYWFFNKNEINYIHADSKNTIYVYPEFEEELIQTIAQILSNIRNGEMFFIGRSPEHIYDFLSGALEHIPVYHNKLHLVNISIRRAYDNTGYDGLEEKQKIAICQYLSKSGLHPKNIIQRKQRTCLIDFVHSGWTFDNLTNFLEKWCIEEKLSVKDMKMKIEFIIIEDETKEGKFIYNKYVNEHGWGRNSLHRIYVKKRFWKACGDDLPKVTNSYTTNIWGEELEVDHSLDRLIGIQFAKKMYELGKSLKGRKMLAKEMSKIGYAMRYTWYRSLVGAIRRNKQIKVHDNVNQVNMRKRRKKKNGMKANFRTWKPL